MHIVEEFVEERNREEEEEDDDDDVYAASMEEKDEYEEEGYNDLVQAFVVEAPVADIPSKKDDKWYVDTGATITSLIDRIGFKGTHPYKIQ